MAARINICLRVLKADNKSRYDTYSVKDFQIVDGVGEFKCALLSKCEEELAPATDASFSLGYYGDGNKKFTISSAIQLAEAISLERRGWITLWADPHQPAAGQVLPKAGRKRKGNIKVAALFK